MRIPKKLIPYSLVLLAGAGLGALGYRWLSRKQAPPELTMDSHYVSDMASGPVDNTIFRDGEPRYHLRTTRSGTPESLERIVRWELYPNGRVKVIGEPVLVQREEAERLDP